MKFLHTERPELNLLPPAIPTLTKKTLLPSYWNQCFMEATGKVTDRENSFSGDDAGLPRKAFIPTLMAVQQ
jgi:hypothetical protein